MTKRNKHPNKEIEAAIQYAERAMQMCTQSKFDDVLILVSMEIAMVINYEKI